MKQDLLLTAVVAFVLGWLACGILDDARRMDQAREDARLERLVCFHRQVSAGYVLPCEEPVTRTGWMRGGDGTFPR